MARIYRLDRDRTDNTEEKKTNQQSDLFTEYWFKQKKETYCKTNIEDKKK